MDRAVFLDRDNTIIHNDGDLGDPRQVRLIQGAASAIASLRGLGYKIIVVSNQGGVARGKYGIEDVDAVNGRIADLIKVNSGAIIDRFYYCPYHPEGSVAEYCKEHPWRKPAPGMLRQAAEDLRLDLEHSWMVGDAMRDIEAGAAAGTRTILLHDHDEPPKLNEGAVKPDFVTRSLVGAVRIIAQHRQKTVELLPAVDGTKMKPPRPPEAAPESLLPRALAGDPGDPGDRPFVPWDVQPQQASPAASPKPALKPKKVPAPPPPPLKAPPSRPAAPEAPQPTEVSAPEALPAPVIEPPRPMPPSPPMRATDESTRDLLQQILRELKAHRADLGDFAMSKMFATLLQMVAAGCVLFSLFHLAEPALFAQWFAGAIFGQLLVITLLLVHGLK